ncbi:hypothetical protein DPMN_133272 [Dreissena polymorpha]|uniref:Uncharacterized protein n=1 Tax=Dreissena polymorpha TaxID=45954 RepID=A0A9D4JAT8_DREPO|nr:hypothetical protein DPMN_133272 [Dreissena polymorpha]
MNRGKPGLHWESIKTFNTSGMNRDGSATTGAAPGTTGTAPPWQSYGNAPVNAVRVPKTGALPERHRHSRGSAGAFPATTGVKPGRCLPAVLRYYGARPAFTGAQPGHYQRQPGLCWDAAGFHWGFSGDNRSSAGASPG